MGELTVYTDDLKASAHEMLAIVLSDESTVNEQDQAASTLVDIIDPKLLILSNQMMLVPEILIRLKKILIYYDYVAIVTGFGIVFKTDDPDFDFVAWQVSCGIQNPIPYPT